MIFTACSDDDDNTTTPPPTDPGGHGGSASFTIEGDHAGEYTGIADFRAFEMAGVYTWDILIMNQDPITYNLSFAQTGGEPIDRPEVGTYELGISQSDDVYLTSFSYYEETPFQGQDYLVGVGQTSGTLVITTSSESLMEGTFSFTAIHYDDEGMEGGSIEVTDGEFSAVPRP